MQFPEFTTVGVVDRQQCDYYDSNIRTVIPKAEWMKKIDADDPEYWNRSTQTLLSDQEAFKANLNTLMQRFNCTDGFHTFQWIYGCELDDDGTKRGYMQFGYDGEDFPTTHSLQYIYTAVTPGTNFPEFSVVGLVDAEQFVYYDSNIRKMIPKTEWIKEVEDEDYWKSETQISQSHEEAFRTSVNNLKQRFNQSEGVHTVQWMYGCELDDDGTKRGYDQYGKDGENFISLDLNR
ncbi:hypothetical protein AOLI_G00274560 [Acnodon oligacanthus]